jgi:predicted metal-dependent phosphoesterase TrpH
VTSGAAPLSARHIDLHLHSTASDGTSAPEGVVASAVQAGLRALALTDHDTVEGIAAAQVAASAAGVELVPGVELSAYEGEQEVHILGLHLADLAEMRRSLEVFRLARRQRAVDIVKKLNDLGVRITFEDVMAVAGDAAIGRPHVARAMVENGWAMDLRDAFDRYLGAGRPAYLDKRRIGIAEAIELVHRCGGIAVLAHPGQDGNLARISAMAAMGIDGVEVIHPSHSAEDRARLLALTSHLGLVPSGGSDSHGGADGIRVVGAMKVPGEWLDSQRARAETVRSRMVRNA